ncbi:hypothetical protein NSB20_20745 [Bacteroides acidifaciens]|uniref:hypothetical protein n=1 Tax=Bacteroides acidifaciens TaxID=85831 RepID=UPI002149DEDB|nr:hypothetical protein [Bacteroides acidifaciens]MCR2007885.1 hypothetical protein [Bacteroides acidifaciens]
MENELKKIELHIERLKAAIMMTQRKARILETDMSDEIDRLLELLSETLKKRKNIKKDIEENTKKK